MASTSNINQPHEELTYLVIQLLEEENLKETARQLGRESKMYFDMKYVEEAVAEGKWEELVKYIRGFTRINNEDSVRIFFEICQQKYLEALCKGEYSKAMEVLRKELTRFTPYYRERINAITSLMYLSTVDELRVSRYHDIDTPSGRGRLFAILKHLIEANPMLRNKLKYPKIEKSRLKTLLNQSLHWQHFLCKRPLTDPLIKTLYEDHSCMVDAHRAMVPSPQGDHMLPSPAFTAFQPVPRHLMISHQERRDNPYSAPAPQAVSGGGSKAINYTENELMQRGIGSSGFSNTVKIISPVTEDTGPSRSYTSCFFRELPTNIHATLTQASAVTSIDFHPINRTLLLGMAMGQVALWDVGSRNMLACRNFTIWNLLGCSASLQGLLEREYSASVKRVAWSPGGVMFGVAYSKHIVHIYSYHDSSYGTLHDNLEIEAHVGSVNDIAFFYPNKSLCFVTCGDDSAVKVWDAVDGSLRYTFAGHDEPVYSVCVRHRQNIKFVFSTAVDGKIKGWLYDAAGPIVSTLDAPRASTHDRSALYTTMIYSTDETRLFLCASQRGGTSHIVEWDENEGKVIRSYCGLVNLTGGVIHFDTTKDKYLAAGDKHIIKFWDMDDDKLLKTTNAGGGLPESPCVRFNKDGMLLAVSTNQCGVKILWTGLV